MCGISGFYNLNGQRADAGLIQRMTAILRHRGPDDQGIYTDGPVALGMARLAIIDLSSAAHQPMPNEDKTVWIVYNGEVYNHRELRKDLEAKKHHYRSKSDAETVLHLYEEAGEDCLTYPRGMYAFAIWDSRKRKLFMAVDRLGIKPLYYTQLEDAFIFASELKAILLHPDIRRQLDLVSLDEYLRYSCVPAPRTIFKDIHRLLPGYCLTVQDGRVLMKQYWELDFNPDYHRREGEWLEQVYHLLRCSVQEELESDVPLGVLLSGGIDSSAIAAFMSQVDHRQVRIFTVGFNNGKQDYGHYDETTFARSVARHFNGSYSEMTVEPKVLDILPRIVWHFDEPFANTTAIAAWYLCKMARQRVTVALTGAGGDEGFGGYPRYIAARFLKIYFSLPAALREGMFKRLARLLPQLPDSYSIFNRVQKFILGARGNPMQTYRNWMSAFSDTELSLLYSPKLRLELSSRNEDTVMDSLLARDKDGGLLNRIFYADLKTYLSDNLLTYSDRMASAHSLEMRVPFCDHRLIELTAAIPPGLKLKGYNQKYLLKKALSGLLPQPVLSRPKQGLSVPLGYWMKGQLLTLARKMLSPRKVKQRGYFDAPFIQGLLDEHLCGKYNHSVKLWSLMVFELWHTLYLDKNIVREPDFSLEEWGKE